MSASRINIPDSSESPVISSLDWRDRPIALEECITQAWDSMKDDEGSSWYYNGEYSDCYAMCGIDEYSLLAGLIKNNPEQKEFYVLDIGAGKFGFGRGLAYFINNIKGLPEDIKIHILG